MPGMRIAFALVFALAACGGVDPDTDAAELDAVNVPCECMVEGCGANSAYARAACAYVEQACDDGDCRHEFSECYSCYRNGIDTWESCAGVYLTHCE